MPKASEYRLQTKFGQQLAQPVFIMRLTGMFFIEGKILRCEFSLGKAETGRRAGRGEDEAADARLQGGLENMHRAGNVDVQQDRRAPRGPGRGRRPGGQPHRGPRKLPGPVQVE